MWDKLLHGTYPSSTVVVVGLGKIGLPLAVQYAQHGYRVIGCDINPAVVETVNAGRSHIQEELDSAFAMFVNQGLRVASGDITAAIATLVNQGLLTASGDITAAVREADVVVVIVPVMIDEQHTVCFEGIDATTAAIGKGLQRDTLVIYETTLPVGTTATRFRPMLEEAAQLQAGRDFYLAYSPERVSSGSIFRDLCTYPKLVGGIDRRSTDAAVAFYREVLEAEIITMASTDEAEFVKLIETTYRDVNIALANEFACYADLRGLDVVAAIAAANTQPYSHIHTPGVGVGGHCIPVYPYFLLAGVDAGRDEVGSHEAGRNKLGPYEVGRADTGRNKLGPHEAGLVLPRYSRQINDAMAEYAATRVEAVTGSLVHKSVLVLGVAYRGDVPELAYTSARLLQDALLRHGATVYVDDPLFSEQELRVSGYTPLAPGCEDGIAAIIVQAAHSAYQQFDFRRFPHCQVVLDGRRAFSRAYITQFGMEYISIGDGQYTKAVVERAAAR